MGRDGNVRNIGAEGEVRWGEARGRAGRGGVCASWRVSSQNDVNAKSRREKKKHARNNTTEPFNRSITVDSISVNSLRRMHIRSSRFVFCKADMTDVMV